MAGRKRGALPADLLKARERFTSWRETKQPRSRIPKQLWKQAVKLVGTHGLNRTASVLRLDYYALKKHVDQSNGQAAFVEVVPALSPPSSECVIELEYCAGAKMRVTLKGHSTLDVTSLISGFWNGD